jgi:hypothetical protein
MQQFSTVVRRRSRAFGAVLCGLAAATSLGLAGCGSSHSKTVASTPTTSTTTSTTSTTAHVTQRNDVLSIMQADGELNDPTSKPSVTIDALAELGATTIRTTINWYNFAPDPTSHTEPAGFNATDPDAYSPEVWKILDGADRAAQAEHVTLYVTLNGLAPLWATGPGLQPGVNPEAWDPSAAKYEQWVKAVGLRYSGKYKPKGQSSPLPRIHFWSIWNEPNYGVNLAPVATDHGTIPTSAEYYRKLVEAGWNGLAATGHTTKTDTILIGETAPRGAINAAGLDKPAELMEPLPFIRAVYCVGTNYKPLRGAAATDIDCPTTSAGTKAFSAQNPALFEATGWADHPYPDAQAPNVNTQPPGVTGDADFANLGALMNTLDSVTGTYGEDPKFPIYSTEFGYQPLPRGPYKTLTQAKAAIYMNQAEYLTWINPRILSYDQYLWHDPPPKPGAGHDFVSGLYAWNGPPKATLPAFQVPLWLPKTSASKGTPLQVWGCARAAYAAANAKHPETSVEIQLSTDGGKTYKTIKTVTLDPAKGGCYFDTQVKFPASGDVRLGWPNSLSSINNGQPEYSRTQAITLS